MELWTQVIVEWINCLDISEVPIKDIKQLQSKKCYDNLINLLPWKNKDALSRDDIVTSFLKDEYPEFKMEKMEQDTDLNNVYVGSLLLLSVSQEPVFHKPMCAKLQQDTQIKIKTFLETVLPYGKDVTKEVLQKTFARLNNAMPKTPSTTPRTHLLKEFFNTPASRSTRSHKRMFEYNRELRHLRSELEMERCEKADMQEDIEILQKKVENLQKKLQEKSSEIKRLREEQTKSSTPQSCKKYKNANNYGDLRGKEFRKLEEEIRQQRREINRIEEEKESVSKKLISMERQCTILKDKCVSFESFIESLSSQIEYRDKELIGLKIINDELRTHLEEYQKINAPDQSCEFDNSLAPLSPNNGEVLSTIVDLQLQEVRVECDKLKEQLESATSKLEGMAEENDRLAKTNSTLQDDVRKMEECIEENKQLKEIAIQKDILENDISKLKDTVAAKDKLLASLSEYIEENARLKEIAARKSILESDIVILQESVAAKDELLASVSVSLNSFISEVHTKLEHIFNKLDSSVTRVRKLENITNELRRNYERKMGLMNTDIENLKSECKKTSCLLNEKKVLKEKLDTARTRNAKLERNLDELRSELKKMKTEHENLSSLPDTECLKQEVRRLKEESILLSKKCEDLNRQPDIEKMEREIARLKEENILLCKQNDDLKNQGDLEKLKEEIGCLKKENVLLSKTNEDLCRKLNESASTDRLQDIHRKYEQKLEDMKLKMKVAHKEQVAKLNEMQNLAVQEKLDNLRTQMRQQCLRHSEETSTYKVRISDLEKEILHTGEKLLIEQQQKQEALQQLNELRIKLERVQDTTQPKSAASTQHNVPDQTGLESSDVLLNTTRTMKVIKEEYCERGHRMHNMSAFGNNTLKTVDEKTEVFDNVHLTNLKEGYYLPIHDDDRLSILQQRNSLYLPHLKSCYPAEMQFHPTGFNEEEVKNITGTPGQGIIGMRQKSRVTDRRQIH